jgi:cardiolipin synthase
VTLFGSRTGRHLATSPVHVEDGNHPDGSEDRVKRVRRTLEGVLGVPATEGNLVQILRNGDRIFPPMLAAIAAAEHTIDFLTFVYWKGDVGTRFADALCERARSGVRVRLLLDAWGARPIDPELIDNMQSAGVLVRWFRPLGRWRLGDLNHRTHRKVLITDESVGFTGGVGISDLWEGDARDENEWRDTHFRIEGPAVDGLRAAFLDNWAETDPSLFDEAHDRFPDQPKPGTTVVQCVRGAAETGESDIATLLRTLLQLAERRVRITTAYFVPDDEMTEFLCRTAERGVRVQVLLPGPFADKRFVQLAGEGSYERLQDCGVELFSYQPTMLHAKAITVDGIVASIGSANFNRRSTGCDEEINLVVIDEQIAGALDAEFDLDLGVSKRIDARRWRERPLRQQLKERLLRPLRRVS